METFLSQHKGENDRREWTRKILACDSFLVYNEEKGEGQKHLKHK